MEITGTVSSQGATILDMTRTLQAPSHSPLMDPLNRYTVLEEFIPELKGKFLGYLKDEFFFSSDKLEVDSETKKVLSSVFDWVIGRNEPNKGFVITGTFGTGKSSIMKAAMKLAYHIYGINQYNRAGMSEPKYITAKQMARIFMENESIKINQLIYAKLLGIDDFGYESKEVVSFGTRVFPFEEILMERYDKKKIILATTNLSPAQISKTYGGHILDRLKQMCFWIELNAPSKRK